MRFALTPRAALPTARGLFVLLKVVIILQNPAGYAANDF